MLLTGNLGFAKKERFDLVLKNFYPPPTDKPHIQIDETKEYYHPRLKQRELRISCNVSADPSPDVNWQRGRTVLSHHDHQHKYEMMAESSGSEDKRTFTLTIKDIREEDFGNYSCLATNALGQDEKEIVISGKPLPPKILSSISTGSKTTYVLR